MPRNAFDLVITPVTRVKSTSRSRSKRSGGKSARVRDRSRSCRDRSARRRRAGSRDESNSSYDPAAKGRVKRGRGHIEGRGRHCSRSPSRKPTRPRSPECPSTRAGRAFQSHRSEPCFPTPMRNLQSLDSHASKGRGRHNGQTPKAVFSVVYWGGAADDGCWDLDNWSSTPRICPQCDSCADTWRGRYDNIQATFRMCGGEGAGFKPYLRHFLMLSTKASATFDLPTFYRWLCARKKKVLNERTVIGSMLETYSRRHRPAECGIDVGNTWSTWEQQLRQVAEQFRSEAHQTRGGKFGALLLDGHGESLRIADMLQKQGDPCVQRLLIIIGGPDGMTPRRTADITRILEEYVDVPIFKCALPGGKMHSYYALATLFMLHDQGLLMPFLGHMCGSAQQTPAPRPTGRERHTTLSPMKGNELRERSSRVMKAFVSEPRSCSPPPGKAETVSGVEAPPQAEVAQSHLQAVVPERERASAQPELAPPQPELEEPLPTAVAFQPPSQPEPTQPELTPPQPALAPPQPELTPPPSPA